MAGPRKRTEEEKKLSERLFEARRALQQVLPEKIAELLTSDHRCLTTGDVWRWRDDVVKKALEMAEPRSDAEMGKSHLPRAYCPLCGDSSQDPYNRGFAFPSGLTMHLCGEKRSHECAVLRVFRLEALDRVEDEFMLRLRTPKNPKAD
jgi:hypothetical protein